MLSRRGRDVAPKRGVARRVDRPGRSRRVDWAGGDSDTHPVSRAQRATPAPPPPEDEPRADRARAVSSRIGAGWRADVLAGLTVTFVGLPQCLAYALMSGLPPAYGLSTAAVAGLVAAVLGRSPRVVTGPTNTTGLLVLGALTPYLGSSGLLEPSGLPVLAALTLLAGLLRIVAAYLGGAKLLRYLPESVLAGFTAGAGVLIGVMQLDEALGLPPLEASGLLSQASGFVSLLAAGVTPSLTSLLVTVLTVSAIQVGRRYLPGWPVALVVLSVGAVLGYALEVSGTGLLLVKDRARMPAGWPPGALPSLDPELWGHLFLPASAIVLLGTLELTVTVRSGDDRPELKREILAQGWANVVGAFLSAFPASASLTRSALLRLTGATSRLAAAAAAVTVLPVLFFAGPAVGYMPTASLAGVLLVTAAGMLHRARLARIWGASSASRALLSVTFVGTLVLPLEVAILVGSGLALLIHLAVTAEPRLTWLCLSGGELVEAPVDDAPTALVAEVSGTLYYAAVPSFLERLEKELPPSCRTLVIDVSHAHQLRFAALEGFEWLTRRLEDRGVEVMLAGVSPEFVRVLRRARSSLTFAEALATPGASARRMLSEAHRRRVVEEG